QGLQEAAARTEGAGRRLVGELFGAVVGTDAMSEAATRGARIQELFAGNTDKATRAATDANSRTGGLSRTLDVLAGNKRRAARAADDLARDLVGVKKPADAAGDASGRAGGLVDLFGG